ncbi:hypothetical protein [Spiroplasma clarkii]|uniref:hypothetical protein n=1 Tax=Spiroplasma clarkii TaxID=2139 RepID=UPI0016498DDC|nr:hypothetical protein [Spiroplasma clarkii]
MSKNKITSEEFYHQILKLVCEMYQGINFTNFDEQTLSLMILILFTRKFNFELPESDFYIIDHKKTSLVKPSDMNLLQLWLTRLS